MRNEVGKMRPELFKKFEKRAKELAKKIESRKEIAKKLSEEFGLSVSTAYVYLGFIVIGKEEKRVNMRALEVLKMIIERPRTLTELSKIYNGNTSNTLRAIRRLQEFGFPIKFIDVLAKSKKRGKRGNVRVFYI